MHMRSLKTHLVALSFAVAATGHAAAQVWLGEEPEFLPVDEAFVLSAEVDDDGALVARWKIADGYYLYRHRFAFKTREGDAEQVGEATIPPGKAKVDEYFGEVEVYYGQARASAPVQAEGEPVEVGIGYQGCAEAGLCYPPQTRWVAVAPAEGTVNFLERDKR